MPSFLSKERLLSWGLLVWVMLAPIRPAMAAAMALPLIDLALGLLVAIRAREPITSTGLKRTVGKLFLYEAATVLAFITETYLTGAAVPAVKMVTGLIGVTELKSCLEHMDSLSGQPLFATILSRLAPPQGSGKDTDGPNPPRE